MYIILRLVYENVCEIAVKISFLLGSKPGMYAEVSSSAIVTSGCIRRHANFYFCYVLYNIIHIAQSMFGGSSEIFHYSDVFASRKKLFKTKCIFKQTRPIILPRKDDVISEIRHSYPKGPFCVTRLIKNNHFWYIFWIEFILSFKLLFLWICYRKWY